eukprot:12411672-Karenia_brevis.AAC.1
MSSVDKALNGSKGVQRSEIVNKLANVSSIESCAVVMRKPFDCALQSSRRREEKIPGCQRLNVSQR